MIQSLGNTRRFCRKTACLPCHMTPTDGVLQSCQIGLLLLSDTFLMLIRVDELVMIPCSTKMMMLRWYNPKYTMLPAAKYEATQPGSAGSGDLNPRSLELWGDGWWLAMASPMVTQLNWMSIDGQCSLSPLKNTWKESFLLVMNPKYPEKKLTLLNVYKLWLMGIAPSFCLMVVGRRSASIKGCDSSFTQK